MIGLEPGKYPTFTMADQIQRCHFHVGSFHWPCCVADRSTLSTPRCNNAACKMYETAFVTAERSAFSCSLREYEFDRSVLVAKCQRSCRASEAQRVSWNALLGRPASLTQGVDVEFTPHGHLQSPWRGRPTHHRRPRACLLGTPSFGLLGSPGLRRCRFRAWPALENCT